MQLTVSLSRRQQECLRWVVLGKSSDDIGTILGISRHTVDEHIAVACQKLGVRTRTQAALRLMLERVSTPESIGVEQI